MGARARLLLSAIVQAWVPKSRMQRALGGAGPRQIALATGLGAASSSCSYAAIAIAKSMFAKGASFTSAMAFQFASTNLVFELGIVMWIFLGWQFTLAELVGGLVLIALMWLGLRLTLTRRLEEEARRNAEHAEAGHRHASAGSEGLAAPRGLTSVRAWSDVGTLPRRRRDALKEITAGRHCGLHRVLPMDFFNGLFLTDAPAPLRLVEKRAGRADRRRAVLRCSVGNVTLAASSGRGVSYRASWPHLRRPDIVRS